MYHDRSPSGMMQEMNITANIIVGADGAYSIIREKLMRLTRQVTYGIELLL